MWFMFNSSVIYPLISLSASFPSTAVVQEVASSWLPFLQTFRSTQISFYKLFFFFNVVCLNNFFHNLGSYKKLSNFF